MPCPCQSHQAYGDCCQPFHLGHQTPQTAEQLMRSRYCAYTLKNIPYIVATTVPSQQLLLDVDAMTQWAESTQWAGLEVLSHRPLGKLHSLVEFNAFFIEEDECKAHHEHSLFVNIHDKWYFVDPTVSLPTQKQPCVCGSGKKFKHCCGAYLA
ncbi:preprotein translocase subunit SecA [Pasteurellaceae bacterium Macca]|nr:preprotein translocase subunit SecA [Pasteurellaceae bacterium Macca]